MAVEIKISISKYLKSSCIFPVVFTPHFSKHYSLTILEMQSTQASGDLADLECAGNL